MKVEALLKRLLAVTVSALVVGELLLVLVSWLLSATATGDVRSLLSSEGIRWFVGGFVSMLSTPWLVYLLLLAMAGGCLWKSGLLSILIPPKTALNYRQRIALRMTFAFLIIYIGVILLLTAVPHAILLSATGQLLPSPFSRAFIPVVAFGLLLLSIAYGRTSGRFASVTEVLDAVSFGVSCTAPLFILYVLAVQFLASMSFVLGL